MMRRLRSSVPVLAACAALVLVAALASAALAATAPTVPTWSLAWGSSGAGPGQFNSPFSIAVDAVGNVYVPDTNNNRIEKFDGQGNLITQWGSLGNGNGQLNLPTFLALDAAGNVYVTDWSNNRVEKFTSSGAYVGQWGSLGAGSGQFNGPDGIAIDAAGNVYVTDYNNDRIEKFTSTGGYLGQWGSAGAGNGQFNGPDGIAVDPFGNVYVADNNNYRVQKFSTAGTYLAQWGTQGAGTGQFNFPGGVACDALGNVYVADVNNERMEKFTGAGVYLGQWGSFGTGMGQFAGPYGVGLDPAGNVYVADFRTNRVQRFSGAGATVTPPSAPYADPFAFQWGSVGSGNGQFNTGEEVTVDLLGDVFVSDHARLQKFDSVGQYVGQFSLSGHGAWGMACDAQNNVYVADGTSTVLKFSSEGVLATQWTAAGAFGVTVDPSGNVFVVDQTFHVYKFTNTGTPITSWGSSGSGPGQMNGLRGVACDAAGNVYVTDSGNNRVQKFSGTGTFLAQWATSGSGAGQFSNPYGITVDPSGGVYVADTFNSRIQKFTTAGAFVTQWGTNGFQPGQLNQPYGLALDAEGDLYVVDQGNARMVKFAHPSPRIARIADVGHDQGGALQLRVLRSPEDAAGTGMTITSYAVYRRNDPVPSSAQPATSPLAVNPPGVDLAGWTYAGSFPAHGESEYSVIVPSLANYTSATSAYYNAYFVRALTSSPLVYIDSPVEYGYSIDNLTPPPPSGFSGTWSGGATSLTWQPSAAPDFATFRLYRGADAGFATDAGHLVAAPDGTSYVDAGPGGNWYKLSAVDVHGNESPATALGPSQIARGSVATPRFALEGVQANPARARDLSVRFTLPTAAEARLELIDVTGRTVASREVGVLGAGAHVIDFARDAVRPGLYFVRLRQGAEHQTVRVTVLE